MGRVQADFAEISVKSPHPLRLQGGEWLLYVERRYGPLAADAVTLGADECMVSGNDLTRRGGRAPSEDAWRWDESIGTGG